ncbi:hypothetical protein Droror1_Dr00025622 [Drosera rotundifolia]
MGSLEEGHCCSDFTLINAYCKMWDFLLVVVHIHGLLMAIVPRTMKKLWLDDQTNWQEEACSYQTTLFVRTRRRVGGGEEGVGQRRRGGGRAGSVTTKEKKRVRQRRGGEWAVIERRGMGGLGDGRGEEEGERRVKRRGGEEVKSRRAVKESWSDLSRS